MATFSNINNNNKNIFKPMISKLEDSKIETYVFRKQINYTLPNNFRQMGFTISSYVPTIKQNLKYQVEEVQKLQSEIHLVEEKIRELEVTKKMKLTKVLILVLIKDR
jgi:uncharacterized protein YebE (UPF0316 family)